MFTDLVHTVKSTTYRYTTCSHTLNDVSYGPKSRLKGTDADVFRQTYDSTGIQNGDLINVYTEPTCNS